jgi:hypothetical protein
MAEFLALIEASTAVKQFPRLVKKGSCAMNTAGRHLRRVHCAPDEGTIPIVPRRMQLMCELVRFFGHVIARRWTIFSGGTAK